jgi:hypothetical protein
MANAVAGAVTLAAERPASWRRRDREQMVKPPEITAERYGLAHSGGIGERGTGWMYRR